MDYRTDVRGVVQGVFTLSAEQKSFLRELLPRVREEGRVGVAKLLDSGERFALFVGRFEEKKAQLSLGELAAEVKDRGFPSLKGSELSGCKVEKPMAPEALLRGELRV